MPVEGRPLLSSVTLDIDGCAWATSQGQIWRQPPQPAAAWQPLWHEPSWQVPFISVFADVGLVIAMTVDGAIVEGRAPSPSAKA